MILRPHITWLTLVQRIIILVLELSQHPQGPGYQHWYWFNLPLNQPVSYRKMYGQTQLKPELGWIHETYENTDDIWLCCHRCHSVVSSQHVHCRLLSLLRLHKWYALLSLHYTTSKAKMCEMSFPKLITYRKLALTANTLKQRLRVHEERHLPQCERCCMRYKAWG